MKAPAIPLVGVHTETAAYQELAAAVLHQAIVDLRDPRATVRDSAAVFLAGSDGFRGWCGVAGLDSEVVLEYAHPLLAPSPEAMGTVKPFRRRCGRAGKGELVPSRSGSGEG